MGTRADFYVGRGVNAEWLGSIAWDGYKSGIPTDLLALNDEAEYRAAVATFLGSRKDGTTPEMGWPWPWDTSHTTDCCYTFDGGVVLCGSWGRWYEDANRVDDDEYEGVPGEFPNMAERKNVNFGDRSGVIFVTG